METTLFEMSEAYIFLVVVVFLKAFMMHVLNCTVHAADEFIQVHLKQIPNEMMYFLCKIIGCVVDPSAKQPNYRFYSRLFCPVHFFVGMLACTLLKRNHFY